MDKSVLQIMLGLGILLVISVFASKTSARYGIPVLLIFIGVGALSGSDGVGGIFFDDASTTQVLGIVALIFILFSGGLSTSIKIVKPVWREGVTLAVVGVLLSTVIMALIIHYVMDWNWVPSALLGATISSTDAAAVFGIFKTQKLQLRSKIQAILELESGSNDPMAVFLTLSLIQLYMGPEHFSWFAIVRSFFIQMSLGAIAGWGMGKILVRLINWLDLEFEGLYPVLTVAFVLCLYSLTEFSGGNGFLSVYLAGLTMSEEKYFSKKTLNVFHDGLAWLMQVAMFLTMGLLVYPSEITPIMGNGVIIAFGLIFLARPLSTYVSLVFFKYSLKEILFLSWGGLRGAVPIILATYFLVSDVPLSKTMFNLVFFIVVVSMLIQGTSLKLMAQLTKVQEFLPEKKWLPFKSHMSHNEFIEFDITEKSGQVGKSVLELQLPQGVLVVLIRRFDKDFIPRGNTQIEHGDKVVCLASKDLIPVVETIFSL